jgi:PKD repeat protein
VAVIAGPASFDEDTDQTFRAAPSSDNVGLVDFAWQVEDVGTVLEFSGALVNHRWEAPGTYAITLTVRDAAGNVGTATRALTVVDTTPPVAVANLPGVVDEDAAVTLDGSGSSDNVGVVRWQWTVEDLGGAVVFAQDPATYTFETPGTYRVSLAVVDAAGHGATATALVEVRDLTAPEGAASVPQEWPEDAPVTFDASATTDNDPEFPAGASYTWRFPDGAPVVLEGPAVAYTFADPGVVEVLLEVADAAGNVYSATFTLRVLDVTVPWVTVTSPAEGALVNTLLTAVAGEVEPGAALSVNGVGMAVSGGAFAGTVATHEGMNVLTFVVTDAAGNAATRRLTVYVDVQAPVLRVARPGPTELTREASVTVEGIASDVHWGALTVAGEAVAVRSDGAFLKTVALVEGQNTIVVEARDAAGNLARFEAVVTRDSTPPTVAVSVDGAPAAGKVLDTEKASVQLQVQSEGAVALEVCQGPSASTQVCRVVALSPDGSWQTALAVDAGQTSTVRVRVTDAAGNSGTAAFALVRAAEAPPPTQDASLWLIVGAAVAAGAVVTVAYLAGRRR